ncbi:hypothetical protein [Mammaliicoccus sp. P-M59]|uniref:hypothetical protein n=1 Tax=Mammaliicoccus sp. P-M59 TaxID=2898718 RepID=UPI001EFBD2EA|nr:hypothetical protein [Mammaliicoccus sp. P-M59]
MTKIDKLEQAIKEAYGQESVLLDCTDDKAIIKYVQNNYIEYIVISHDYVSMFNGSYFAPIGQTVEQARKHAWDKYKKTI